VQLDHLLVAVPDLEQAAGALGERFGLTAVEGGAHPGWGTANRIVPLGATYIELVTVVDRRQAAGHPFGRWAARRLGGGGGLLGWALRPPDLDGTAARLGLTAESGSRRTGDGRELRWRMAGVEQAAAEPCLPFFLEWGAGTPFPGEIEVQHPAGDARWTGVQVRGDAERVARWVDDARAGVEVLPGRPAIERAVLSNAVLDAESLDRLTR
jgi:glyoxalase-like protein